MDFSIAKITVSHSQAMLGILCNYFDGDIIFIWSITERKILKKIVFSDQEIVRITFAGNDKSLVALTGSSGLYVIPLTKESSYYIGEITSYGEVSDFFSKQQSNKVIVIVDEQAYEVPLNKSAKGTILRGICGNTGFLTKHDQIFVMGGCGEAFCISADTAKVVAYAQVSSEYITRIEYADWLECFFIWDTASLYCWNVLNSSITKLHHSNRPKLDLFLPGGVSKRHNAVISLVDGTHICIFDAKTLHRKAYFSSTGKMFSSLVVTEDEVFCITDKAEIKVFRVADQALIYTLNLEHL